jgi:uncharacterized protein
MEVKSTDISDDEVMQRFPDVLVDYDNLEHFRGLLQRRLLINRCQQCGYWIYPHRPMCPKCWSWRVEPTEVSGKGTLYMFTLSLPTHLGSRIAGLDYAEPTPIGGVELPEREGLRYLAQIVNCPVDDIRIGMLMRLTWIDRNGTPAPAFEPDRAVDSAAVGASKAPSGGRKK